MPDFIYEGRAHSLRVAGRTLVRGSQTTLEGHAAESAAAYAAKHPDLREIGSDNKPAKTASGRSKALADRQALVARAKELGIPAKGKSADLAAAVAAAEADAAD